MLNARLNRDPITRSVCIATVIALLSITVPIAGFGAAASSASDTFSGSVFNQTGAAIKSQGSGTKDQEPQRVQRDITRQVGSVKEQLAELGTSAQTASATFSGFALDQAGGVMRDVRR